MIVLNSFICWVCQNSVLWMSRTGNYVKRWRHTSRDGRHVVFSITDMFNEVKCHREPFRYRSVHPGTPARKSVIVRHCQVRAVFGCVRVWTRIRWGETSHAQVVLCIGWKNWPQTSALPSAVVQASSSIVFKRILDCVDLTQYYFFKVFLLCILSYVIMIMLGQV